VVDAQLRVRGVNAFRMADASITPCDRGSIIASTITIAGKVADIILGRQDSSVR
jgi:hypothetical protein